MTSHVHVTFGLASILIYFLSDKIVSWDYQYSVSCVFVSQTVNILLIGKGGEMIKTLQVCLMVKWRIM